MANAKISIAPVTPDDQFANFDSRGVSNAVWTDYFISSRYEKDYQRYMLGTTSDQLITRTVSTSPGNQAPSAPRNTVAVVQLARPTLLWVVDWTAARAKELPFIPDPEQLSSTKWVLLGEKLEPAMIVPGPDGVTPIYRISGTYVYAQLAPDARTHQDAVFPIPPWIKKEAFPRKIPSNIFERDLTNDKKPQ